MPAACLARLVDHAGSAWRRDGGSARSSAGLSLLHTSWGGADSREGKACSAPARWCPGPSSALDLTPMRMASRSSVAAMACAVGLAASCVTMKLSMACS